MAIQTTVVGSYPKPPDEGGKFTVRKTLHALEKGDATVDDLHAAHALRIGDFNFASKTSH